jgi:hypothetical protein
MQGTYSTSSSVSGHPNVFKSAVYDVITHDLQSGPVAAAAEVIGVLNECLNAFPTLDQNCEIRISHAKSEHLIYPASCIVLIPTSSQAHRIRAHPTPAVV